MPNENDGIRTFLAIYPDADALQRICEYRDRFREKMPRSGVRWTTDRQLHLTLKFVDSLPLNVVPELIERLHAISKDLEAMPLKASFIGSLWQSCRVLGLSIDSNDNKLAKVQQCVEDLFLDLGIPKETRAFNAHLTLARIENPRLIPAMERSIVAEWVCSEWVLVKSELTNQGAIHTPLAKCPFG